MRTGVSCRPPCPSLAQKRLRKKNGGLGLLKGGLPNANGPEIEEIKRRWPARPRQCAPETKKMRNALTFMRTFTGNKWDWKKVSPP